MRFARHETFHFREGWLSKGLSKIGCQKTRDVFMRKTAMEELGIGNNMVRSLRYWMQATYLTREVHKKDQKGQLLTPDFGQIIFEKDRWFEEEFTLWLLHYQLAKGKEFSTSWFWFFNVFNQKEFDKEIFVNELEGWVREQGEDIARGSLEKDFDCFLSTYVSNKDTNVNPEDNFGCPLQDLGLIEVIDSKSKRYRVTRRDVKSMPKEVFMFAICDYMKLNNIDKNLSIDQLLLEEGSIGRVFALGLQELIQVLETLQATEQLVMTKTAGLNNVSINNYQEPVEILEGYYAMRDRGFLDE